jgi:carbon-monoxide dehydrogenase large subunit
MRLVSIAVAAAVEALIGKGKRIAGHLVQASPDEVVYESGLFKSPTGASVNLAAAALAARDLDDLPIDLRGEFSAAGDITDNAGGYPYGCHVCEVEVDPETGVVSVEAWTAVDDVGLAVNPLILHGQAHGAIAQGLGQALCEAIVHDPATGQMLTGSYLEYAMPRADHVPAFNTLIGEVPATSHPFGIRPGGEGGTTPALALLVNAVADALTPLGIRHIDIPLTPERVWRAIAERPRHQ